MTACELHATNKEFKIKMNFLIYDTFYSEITIMV